MNRSIDGVRPPATRRLPAWPAGLSALGLALALGGAEPGAAQASRAALTITEADVRRRVNLIADDSMGGRDTPSPGLEKTAAYLAREFKRMGLEPGGDQGGYLQRYAIRTRTIDPAGSWVSFADETGERIKLPFGQDANPMFGAPRSAHLAVPFVLLGGPVRLDSKADLKALAGKGIVWIAPPGQRPNFVAVISLATATKAPFVLSLIADDSVYAKLPKAGAEVMTADSVGWPVIMSIRESSVLRQAPEAQEQLSAVRSAAEFTVVEVPGWTATAHTQFTKDEPVAVPNVIGMVRGTDPALRDQAVIVTAHMDHVGSRCRGADGPDKICNGADDNASGTTGVLELAEAFANPAARPKRTMIFAAVSGEERGLWGSQYVAEHPPVPIDRIAANVNMDHLGRNWRDSIAVIGMEHSDLGALVERVHAAHPELGVTPIGDRWPGEDIYFRSDHYNFARLGVPILFFTNGFHPDYHAVTDSPDKIDAEKESRVLRLMYYVLAEISSTPDRPKWKPESYETIVRK
jgi:hypothetical protein